MASISDVPEAARLPLVNFDHIPTHQREERALLFAEEERQRPFDLSAGPLIRFCTLAPDSDRAELVLATHHIVMDGWSIGVLLKEMTEFYEAFHTSRSPEIPHFRSNTGISQPGSANPFAGEVSTRQLEYWKRTLNGAPTVLELPADRPLSRGAEPQGAHIQSAT